MAGITAASTIRHKDFGYPGLQKSMPGLAPGALYPPAIETTHVKDESHARPLARHSGQSEPIARARLRVRLRGKRAAGSDSVTESHLEKIDDNASRRRQRNSLRPTRIEAVRRRRFTPEAMARSAFGRAYWNDAMTRQLRAQSASAVARIQADRLRWKAEQDARQKCVKKRIRQRRIAAKRAAHGADDCPAGENSG